MKKLLALLYVMGCQALEPTGNPTQIAGAQPRFEPEMATAAGNSQTPRHTVQVSVDTEDSTVSEPLRDLRERRLRKVKQLTHGSAVSAPRFSADGQTVSVLARLGRDIDLFRIPLADPERTRPEHLALSGIPWGFFGDPLVTEGCLVVAPAGCAADGWPDPQALAACHGLSVSHLLGRGSCPAVAGPALPGGEAPLCAVHGAMQACPVPAADGSQIALREGSQTRLLGALGASASMPAFAPDGRRLVFAMAPKDGLAQLQVLQLDQLAAEPVALGPEARQVLDPVFTPDGNQVVFASTADDSAEKELELYAVPVPGSGGGGGAERLTFTPGVDRFPAFSMDGKQLAWVSERSSDGHGPDVFVAAWQGLP